MAAKKSFGEKLLTKTSNKMADKLASGIVKAVTTKPKKSTATKSKTVEDKPAKTSAKKSTAKKATSTKSETVSQQGPSDAARFNTKRCPNCQAVCFNTPLECPYCHADLKSVAPMSPKEYDELTQ